MIAHENDRTSQKKIWKLILSCIFRSQMVWPEWVDTTSVIGKAKAAYVSLNKDLEEFGIRFKIC